MGKHFECMAATAGQGIRNRHGDNEAPRNNRIVVLAYSNFLTAVPRAPGAWFIRFEILRTCEI